MNTDTTQAIAAAGVADWKGMLDSATREVFEVMLASTLGPASNGHANPEGGTVTAFVGLGGDLRAVVSVVTSFVGAHQMTAAMLGMPVEDTGDSTWDALGEICNMVAGAFKGKLESVHCVLSLPTVVMGADYRTRVLNNGLAVECQMTFQGEMLRVLLEIHDQG